MMNSLKLLAAAATVVGLAVGGATTIAAGAHDVTASDVLGGRVVMTAYAGKPLAISGKLLAAEVGVGFGTDGVLAVSQDGQWHDGVVYCTFAKSQFAKAAALPAGTPVTVTGIVEPKPSFLKNGVLLSSCSF